jgi:hypothetical protein
VNICWKNASTYAYCGKRDLPLQVEHIQPRGRGGSNRLSNLTLACEPCNTRKGNSPLREFLGGKSEQINRIQAQMKAPLRVAAAVNATRYAIGNALRGFGLLPRFWTGRTKFNRNIQGCAKDHWIDVACVGEWSSRPPGAALDKWFAPTVTDSRAGPPDAASVF